MEETQLILYVGYVIVVNIHFGLTFVYFCAPSVTAVELGIRSVQSITCS